MPTTPTGRISARPALFIPCLVDAFFPEVGQAVFAVLRRLGIDPVYPEGQTLVEDTPEAVRSNLLVQEAYLGGGAAPC